MANTCDKSIRSLTIIAIITDVLFIITASIGIWLANGYDHFTSTTTENAVKGFLITILVLAILLPVLFLLFAYVFRHK